MLTETLWLLRSAPTAQDEVLEWLGRGAIVVAFDLADDSAAVRRLMRKHRDRPMSLADACLVRMAESRPGHVVCTLDGDFLVHRRDGGAAIGLVTPAGAA